MNYQVIIEYIYLVPVVLISLSFHEFSHAFIAYKLGDPTAKNMGRLTLNPLRHLDILGTIMMFVAKIGWAKPVQINPAFFKDRRKGTLYVSAAGPFSNLLLAFIFAFPMLYIDSKYNLIVLGISDIRIILFDICFLLFIVNINLAIFNLIPVPPLDGSKILSGILPPRQYYKILQYENYISIIFLVIVFMFMRQFSIFMNIIASPIRTTIIRIVRPIIELLL